MFGSSLEAHPYITPLGVLHNFARPRVSSLTGSPSSPIPCRQAVGLVSLSEHEKRENQDFSGQSIATR